MARDDSEYIKLITKFGEKFEDCLRATDEENNNKTGYIFLFVRKKKTGCIDLGSNLADHTILDVLEMAIDEIKAGNMGTEIGYPENEK